MGLSIPSLVFLASAAAAAAQSGVTDPSSQNTQVSFRPSIGIVMGIFVVMFTLTFLLLIYAKFCHSAALGLFGPGLPEAALGPPRRASGVDKAVISSLPFFRFSHLKGSRDGLECAVCLSRFEDSEMLRLLPKCKHAFHIACVDRWLEGHSSCPLCRCHVAAEDAAVFTHSGDSQSLLRNPSTRRPDDGAAVDLELFVEREPSARHASSRFTIGSSFRKNHEEALLPPEDGQEQLLHKFKHRIIVSDLFFKSRWSDLNSSDLMSLNSDMLNSMSSNRFDLNAREIVVDEKVVKIKEEMEKKRVLESKATRINRSNSVSSPLDTPSASAAVEHYYSSGGSTSFIAPGDRCMSEITNVSRFRVAKDPTTVDDRARRLWLPIARRTVQWLAGRERRSEPRYTREAMDV